MPPFLCGSERELAVCLEIGAFVSYGFPASQSESVDGIHSDCGNLVADFGEILPTDDDFILFHGVFSLSW